MNTREIIKSDIDMIKCLFDGGMEKSAQELLKQVYKDYSEKIDADFKKASIYLKDLLYPQICHQPMPHISIKEQFISGIRMREIEWMEWLSYFPGSSVESLEDRQHGHPIVWGKERVDADWFKDRKAGVFYSINGFHETIRPGMKRRREKGNLKSFNAVTIDLDKAATADLKAVHVKQIGQSKLLPSFVVETRNGFHVIWLLEIGYDEKDTSDWKRIQNGLIGLFGGDKACSDVSRLLRMPSSWHCKDMWNGGEPTKVKLMFESGRKYRMEDFAVFGFKQEKKIVKLKDFIPSGKLIEPKPTLLGAGDRHAALKEEAGRLYARLGKDPSKANEARNIIKNWYQKSCNPLKQEWESEVDKCCDWVEIQQFGQKV